MTKFRDLRNGQTFDFISDDHRFNSYFECCVKVSARCYVAEEGDGRGEPSVMRVGTINCEVYHVQ